MQIYFQPSILMPYFQNSLIDITDLLQISPQISAISLLVMKPQYMAKGIKRNLV